MRHATDIFSEWALGGKDEGMEKNHSLSVREMLLHLTKNVKTSFSFIDAGCGNGWVVRKMQKNPLCSMAKGVDGAEDMIRKAKAIDPDGDYICADLLKWIPNEKVDFVHSMEVFYYFENPGELINHIKSNWLKPGGKMVMGIDFYEEHERSHSWPTDLGTHMTLLSEAKWVSLFSQNGFYQIENFRANVHDGFPGTLVVSGVLNSL
ncbi:MAG: class I SAM-dependent methyltransferase [Candidatus Marinimicrobia bacterium]|jgi:trans-aconitate methyltransferase|nr:class I SAM-dependent methyltransferase [Candidatus Neomarinimicrobiota bacterium]MBT4154790.1 class I SAM-dependent methyltransferase [Candidatus Neomarinimicrobiota bacterium]MBT4554328.1 class I SAM-dependent methyltransferase [Candidatus Neomarinimicrobiota bacterium]MBT4753054.1 class I SAM-dependent methyltransferase [Candidatus Neomarinimicrobiota bacterium]MBT5748678.1 class I SAM-dependent methyltransferase [Candidatus Neomarinimicrobiota bacterium]|tara:strand:- start:2592 stop:3209 length:618 start_codon:yes stop_codon:yes gene_type:complete